MQGNRTYKLGTRKLTWKWKPKRLKTKKQIILTRAHRGKNTAE